MQESVIYQDIQEEASQKKAQQIAVNLLKEGMTLETIVRVTGLSIEQIQQVQSMAKQTPQE